MNDTATGKGSNSPLLRYTALSAYSWKALGASEILTRHIWHGIGEMPTIPFVVGKKLPSTPQIEKYLLFASENIFIVVGGRVFERISEEYAHRCLREVKLISSAFVSWFTEGEDEKERFVLNF